MYSKTKVDRSDLELSFFARNLALPVRISILKILLSYDTWVTNEVFNDLLLTPVTRDRHLRALKDVGLLEEKHQKGVIYFKLNNVRFQTMINNFTLFFSLFNDTNLSEPEHQPTT